MPYKTPFVRHDVPVIAHAHVRKSRKPDFAPAVLGGGGLGREAAYGKGETSFLGCAGNFEGTRFVYSSNALMPIADRSMQ